MNTTKIIFLVVLAILVVYLLAAGGGFKASQMMPESFSQPSDLNKAQDDLDYVNIDSVDTGVNQLNTEVSTY